MTLGGYWKLNTSVKHSQSLSSPASKDRFKCDLLCPSHFFWRWNSLSFNFVLKNMLDIFHAEIKLAKAYSLLRWKMKQVPNCRKINLWQSSRAIFAVATWYLSQLGTKGLVIYVFLTAVPARGSTAWLRWAVSLSETLSIPQLVPSQRSRCLMTGLPLQIEIQSSGIKKKKEKTKIFCAQWCFLK